MKINLDVVTKDIELSASDDDADAKRSLLLASASNQKSLPNMRVSKMYDSEGSLAAIGSRPDSSVSSSQNAADMRPSLLGCFTVRAGRQKKTVPHRDLAASAGYLQRSGA